MNHFNVNHCLFVLNRKISYSYIQYSSYLLFSNSKHRLKTEFWLDERKEKKCHSRSFVKNLHRTYRSLCLGVTFIVRLFILIDRLTRKIFTFIEKLIRIIERVRGWIKMLKSIFSAVHLIIARLMILTFKIYQIFYLLSILFEPFSKRTFEKSVRSFSHFLYDYYSSNGACYTLKARTHHVVSRIRARWKKDRIIFNDVDDDDIYYDAVNGEYQ